MKYVCLVLTLMIFGCNTQVKNSNSQWRLVYNHDKQGNKISGDKQKLITLIKNGHPVRIVWPIRENFHHMMDAGFITIMNEDVFAQANPIIRQIPDKKTRNTIYLDAEQQSQWRAIFSTSGELSHFQSIDKKMHQSRFGLKWFVQY